MKMSKIITAIATASMAVSAGAAINGGVLDGLTTDSAPAGNGVSAIAIIVNGEVHNALQTQQGLGAACIGNRNKLCAPSLSSAEIRGLLNNSWTSTNLVTGEVGGTLFSHYGDTTNYTEAQATKSALNHGHVSANVGDALNSFVQSNAVIAGQSCGQGAGLEQNFTGATDADIIAAVSTSDGLKHKVGFIHATELDDANQNYGFVKLDGSAPDLVNLASSNYNLVSNLGGTLPSSDKSTHGMTVGASVAGGSLGIAYHNFAGSFNPCAPLDTNTHVLEANGGPL